VYHNTLSSLNIVKTAGKAVGFEINVAHESITMRNYLLLLVSSRCLLDQGSCWLTKAPGQVCSNSHPTSTTALPMNVLSDIGDFLSGGKLEAQTEPLMYGAPLGEPYTESRTLAVQERAFSLTGEDFDVWSVEENAPCCTVRGAMLHLPGKDKMRIKQRNGQVLATLDRKLVALSSTYDIQRGDGGEKIGYLEKAKIALTDTFDFHAENNGGFGLFKPPPAFKLEGDFLDRRFVMKNVKGQVVAKISQDQLIEFDQFNHYQIRIAPGMDPILVVACACAIDEELDEEHRRRREEQNR
jgi:uncharacterized protein YxjI